MLAGRSPFLDFPGRSHRCTQDKKGSETTVSWKRSYRFLFLLRDRVSVTDLVWWNGCRYGIYFLIGCLILRFLVKSQWDTNCIHLQVNGLKGSFGWGTGYLPWDAGGPVRVLGRRLVCIGNRGVKVMRSVTGHKRVFFAISGNVRLDWTCFRLWNEYSSLKRAALLSLPKGQCKKYWLNHLGIFFINN